MSYTPTVWETGNVVTAQKLNKLENGLASVASDADDLKSKFDDLVMDRYELLSPTNLFDKDSITSGILKKDGTTEEASNRIYTDYIPVTGLSKISWWRGDTFGALYARNVAVYDENKTIQPLLGYDGPLYNSFTIPSGAAYVRVTLDYYSSIVSVYMIVSGTTAPSAYSSYFTPYYQISDDFVTPESDAVLDSIKAGTFGLKSLDNRFGCAFLKRKFRQTVGIPEKFYYAAAVTPDKTTTCFISAGTDYQELHDDGAYFPNETAYSGNNGYMWYMYDANFALVKQYLINSGHGQARSFLAESLSDCSLLAIGDSTVDHDVMTQELLEHFTAFGATITLLGTLGSGLNKNEGRAGWKASDYLTGKTYNGVVNPFYNPTSQTFDFSYYMTNQGYSAPTFVVIQLGINDLYNGATKENTWSCIQTMIDSILDYNNGIKIILNLPTTPNGDQSKLSVWLPSYKNRVVRYNEYAIDQCLAKYAESSVRVSYCHLILNPMEDISDNVHPTSDGYEKMALEIINQINHWQNNS